MQPVDCPDYWDYEDHPDHKGVLKHETKKLLARLSAGLPIEVAADTRREHAQLCGRLVPKGYEYFAGNYRGAQFRCLKEYEVGVGGDRRVGTAAAQVTSEMEALATALMSSESKIDKYLTEGPPAVSQEEKLRYVARFTCMVFERFLRIHPYANGNGHMARLIVWVLMRRFGYWPVRFDIHPRPTHLGYASMIKLYRDGNRDPLERYLIDCIAR